MLKRSFYISEYTFYVNFNISSFSLGDWQRPRLPLIHICKYDWFSFTSLSSLPFLSFWLSPFVDIWPISCSCPCVGKLYSLSAHYGYCYTQVIYGTWTLKGEAIVISLWRITNKHVNGWNLEVFNQYCVWVIYFSYSLDSCSLQSNLNQNDICYV